jgi:hypothetical protein
MEPDRDSVALHAISLGTVFGLDFFAIFRRGDGLLLVAVCATST